MIPQPPFIEHGADPGSFGAVCCPRMVWTSGRERSSSKTPSWATSGPLIPHVTGLRTGAQHGTSIVDAGECFGYFKHQRVAGQDCSLISLNADVPNG
jgi:hypothetical protein